MLPCSSGPERSSRPTRCAISRHRRPILPRSTTRTHGPGKTMRVGGRVATIDRSLTQTITLGLRANWRQFALLVAVNAFVGGMIGLERTVMPLLAERDFGLVSRTAILSFIVSFGIVK